MSNDTINILKRKHTNEISIKTGSQEIWFNLDNESSIELYQKLGKSIHDGAPDRNKVTLATFYGGYNLLD